MKHILLIILLCCSINSVAQDPNPDLFQTWYLYYVIVGSTEFEVSEIEPPITPTLTISQNFNFNGEGACNLFNGTYETMNSTTIRTETFSSETDDCGIPIHNSFESKYFDVMEFGGWYVITPETNGMMMTIEIPLGQSAFAIYKNYELNVMNFALNNIQIYPIPSSSIINITSPQNPVVSIEVFDLFGKNLLTQNIDVETVDVSDLDTGIYLMKISTMEGTIIRKIAKN
jgi:hypothetical protein